MIKNCVLPIMIALTASSPAFGQETVEDRGEKTVPTIFLPAPKPSEPPQPDLSRPPLPVDGSFDYIIRQSDYPLSSWVADEEGQVRYELAIDADGNITGCTIIESSGFPALDNKSCEIVTERAKFTAASDEDGKPISDVYAGRLYWRKREPDIDGNFTIHVDFMVDEEGRQVECNTIEFSGDIPDRIRRSFEREPCLGSSGLSEDIPYRDANGNPVAKRVTLKLVVTSEEIEE
ncbi:energy transducer TonB [Alterisphingorhabdus coralli]|uniref:TonB family protein n=1 Tax=Alterisphingorhabdus coralli TaxID=3071408 RepID=A0AA97F7Z9_9SPHN|nr:TonB family protein [Parasphingorhabdus sp. SCSIO 66989]WOE74963.1 TonB family protein [Parasphingorhabdus sp. SCSIO 66989]